MYIIYRAVNLINGKCYVGKTAVSFERRQWQHINDSKIFRYNSIFHNAIRKYGIENFQWEIIYECDNKLVLNVMETMKIIVNHSHYTEGGYNLTWGGDGQSKGYKPSSIAIQKMSDFQRGRKKTDEHKRKISDAHKGKKVTEESKRKNREAHLGKKASLETRMKLSLLHTGSIRTKEHQQKLSESRRKYTDEIMDNVFSLNEKGFTFVEISGIMGIPSGTIGYWIRQKKKTK